MDQRRRWLLAAIGSASIGGIAGCNSTDNTSTSQQLASDTRTSPSTPGSTETPTPSSSPTATPSETPTDQPTTLVPEDGDDDDSFGGAVAVSDDGSTALIGASGDEDPNGEKAGAAYVFSGSTGTWTQEAKLAADDGDDEDRFGDSVAVSGDGSTAIIGAYPDDNQNGELAGSAYVFSGSGGAWTQEAKLVADDGDDKDWFGWSVAVSPDGSTALIGARTDEGPEGYGVAGSAYVFSGSGGSWTQETKLVAEDRDSPDRFGNSVAVSGDGSTAVIGAATDGEPNGEEAGSAYVFSGSGGAWTQEAKLVADDGDDKDWFGWSVAVSPDGSTALIGAYRDEDPNGKKAGSAYVFSGSGESWTQAAKLAAEDGDDGDWFGNSVAVSGDGSSAIVGAIGDEDPNGERAGSAYMFSGSGGSWTQAAKLAADDGEDHDRFGTSVAVSNDGSTAIIGAAGDEAPNDDDTGSASVVPTAGLS